MDNITEEELIQIRRQLHQIPEIGLEEVKTSAYLLEKIKTLPQENLTILTQDTAIIVKVKGSESKKTIAWRTDMDGLPMSEETGLSFSSTHVKKMHACGHDFHMTIALGVLYKVAHSPLKNDIVFFFQPAEENKSGAKIYTDNQFLDVDAIDEIYGLHVHPDLPVGMVSTCPGTLFAGDCSFNVTFIGKESHAAFPHEGNDMIVASASFIQQVQSIVSRNVNPMESAVITFGQITAGIASNILPGSAYLTGTARTLTHEMTDLLWERIESIAKGVAMSFECEVILKRDDLGYVPVVNNELTTKYFMNFLKEREDTELMLASPLMTAEDFGYILKQIPGTMFWLGVDSKYGLHHPKFNPDERALKKAVELVSDFLKARDN